MSTTYDTINARIARDINPSIELVRGEGYHYFVYDDPHANVFETESVMVCALSHLRPQQWLDAAQTFHDRMCKQIRESVDFEPKFKTVFRLAEGDIVVAPKPPAAERKFEVALWETREGTHRLVGRFDLSSDAVEAARALSRVGREGALITLLDTRRGDRTVFWFHNGRRLDLDEAVLAGLMFSTEARVHA